jgi:hypothetical protein
VFTRGRSSPLHRDLRMLLQWVYQDGQWKGAS